ncbi:MAG: hypothetical protein IPJ81_01125 [Chitinophagaceae bacterium]|nr:hypothetical protein [Chitinophagaceae bacterium]
MIYSINYFKFFCAVFLCSFLFSHCTNNKDKKKAVATDTPTSGTIHISVDETFEPVISEQIKVYESINPNAK